MHLPGDVDTYAIRKGSKAFKLQVSRYLDRQPCLSGIFLPANLNSHIKGVIYYINMMNDH